MNKAHRKKILEINKNHYNRSCKYLPVFDPQKWPQWEIISKFQESTCLEIGPGTRPRIPISKNHFLDISSEVVAKLRKFGGNAVQTDLSHKFPYRDKTFDLVCAFEILEHLPNDVFVLQEIARTLKDKGLCFFSFPLHMRIWTAYDETVGHIRRYEVEELDALFKRADLKVIRSAAQNIHWPGYWAAKFFSRVVKMFPAFISRFDRSADMLPSSPVRKTLHFTKWDREAKEDLQKANTGLFLLEKNV